MKLAITNISFFKKNIDQFLDFVSRNSIKYLELCPTLISNNLSDLSKFERIGIKIKEIKSKVISLNAVFFSYEKKFKGYDKDIKNLEIFFLKIINIAKKLNCKNISIGALPSRKIKDNFDKCLDINLKVFQKLNKLCNKKKIFLLIEPVSKSEGVFFLNNPDEVIEFIEKYKLRNCKLLLDFGNLELEKISYKKYIIKNLKNIHHIHVRGKNMKYFNKKNTNKIITFLRKHYKKTFTLEYLSPNGKALENINLNNLKNSHFLKKDKKTIYF